MTIEELEARCTALEQERDKSNKHEADAWLQVEEWRTRCQHLEQENEELKGRIANALL